jgi:hypothetical protein
MPQPYTFDSPIGRPFEVQYAGYDPEDANVPCFVRVLHMRDGFLYVQPITADGIDRGETLWLSGACILVLVPLRDVLCPDEG